MPVYSTISVPTPFAAIGVAHPFEGSVHAEASQTRRPPLAWTSTLEASVAQTPAEEARGEVTGHSAGRVASSPDARLRVDGAPSCSAALPRRA